MSKNNKNKEILSQNLQGLMDIHKKTRQDVADALGIKYTRVADWLTCRTYPRQDILGELADYFKVPCSALVDPPATINNTVNGDNNGTISTTTGSINNSTINNGTINGNIITPSTTENDTCQMYHALSAEARGQIDNLVKMLHDMENKK